MNISGNSSRNKKSALQHKLDKIKKQRQDRQDQDKQNQHFYPYQGLKKKHKCGDDNSNDGIRVKIDAVEHITECKAESENATSAFQHIDKADKTGKEAGGVDNVNNSELSKLSRLSNNIARPSEKTISDETLINDKLSTPDGQNTKIRDSKYYQKWRSPFEDYYQCFRRKFRRMEIWYADLGYHNGLCFEDGRRPVLIISNDTNNEVAPIVTVIPLSSNISKLHLGTHVLIEPSDVSDVLITPNGRSDSRYYAHRASASCSSVSCSSASRCGSSRESNCESNHEANHEANHRSNCGKGHGRSINKSNKNGGGRNNTATFAPYYEHLYNRPGSTLIEQMTVIDKRLLDSYLGQIVEPKKIEILNNAVKAFLGVDLGVDVDEEM